MDSLPVQLTCIISVATNGSSANVAMEGLWLELPSSPLLLDGDEPAVGQLDNSMAAQGSWLDLPSHTGDEADEDSPAAAPMVLSEMAAHAGWLAVPGAEDRRAAEIVRRRHVPSHSSDGSCDSPEAPPERKRGRPWGSAAARRLEAEGLPCPCSEEPAAGSVSGSSIGGHLGRQSSPRSFPRRHRPYCLVTLPSRVPAEEQVVALPPPTGVESSFQLCCQSFEKAVAVGKEVPEHSIDPEIRSSVESVLALRDRPVPGSTKVEAELLKRSCFRLKSLKHRVAAGVLARSGVGLSTLRRELRDTATQHPMDFKVLLDISGRSYDETPTRLRVGDEGAALAKVLQSSMLWAFLLKVRIPARELRPEGWQHVLLRGRTATSLQAMESNAAECVRQAIADQCPTLYHSIGERKVHLVCTDGATANSRAERGILQDPPLGIVPGPGEAVSLLHINCAAHKAQAVMKQVDSLVPAVSTGILNLGLSLRSCGALSVLRRILAETIKDRLRVIQSSPPPPNVAARNLKLIRIFCARGGRRRKRLGAIFALLTNGDWNDEKSVQHFCAGPSCCASQADTLKKFVKYVVPALAGVMFSIFARSRWQGAYNAVDQQGMFANVHGLLTVVYHRWAELQGDSKLGFGDGSAHPVCLPLEEGGDEAGATDGSQNALAIVQHPAAGNCEPPAAEKAQAAESEDAVEKWRQEQKAFRAKALMYLAPECCPGDHLLLLRLTMEPQVRLMDQLLYLSSNRWEERQLKKCWRARPALTKLSNWHLVAQWSFALPKSAVCSSTSPFLLVAKP